MAFSSVTEKAFPGPSSSFTYLSQQRDMSLSFTRVGQPLPKMTSASARKAWATPRAISLIRVLIILRLSSSKVRRVPPMVTVSGMTLEAVPAFMVPKVSTAFSPMASSLAWIS